MATLKTTIFDLYDLAGHTVWVEDDLTRTFLTEIWHDPQIRIVNASNKDGVKNLVNAAPLDKRGKKVIGLVDKDFDLAVAHGDGKPIMTTEGHEFENCLLDFDLLETLAKESAASIESLAKQFATDMLWWMACKHALRDMKRNLSTDFPADPSVGPMTQDAAVEHICNGKYAKSLEDAAKKFTTVDIKTSVAQRGHAYANDLASPDAKWKRTFSGKEIFRHVRCHVSGLVRFARPGSTAAQNDEDLAKRIARELVKPHCAQHPLKLQLDAWKVALKQRV
jgi:hypothetical protein